MFGRNLRFRGKSSYSTASSKKRTLRGFGGTTNLNNQVRAGLSNLKTKTNYTVPAASSFNIKKSVQATPSAFNRNPFTRIPKQIVPRQQPSFTPPAPPPAPPPKSQPKVVKRQTPPATNVIKRSPARQTPPATQNLMPRGASMTTSNRDPNDARFGDRGFEDVMTYSPPPKKNVKVRGVVRSQPVREDFIKNVDARIPVGDSRPSNENIRPMAEILQDVADRARVRDLENQGLSAAELRNTRGVIENRIVQNVREGRDPGAGIRERDLALAGEELRDARGNRYTSGVVKFDRGQQILPKVVPVGSDVLTVSVKTKPGNCEVLVNGLPQGLTKLTPTILTFTAKETIGAGKSITVRRNGYRSNESYRVVGRIEQKTTVIEKKVLDDSFDEYNDFLTPEPSFIRGGLNPLMAGNFNQGGRNYNEAGELFGGRGGFGFNRDTDERERVRSISENRRLIKPKYKTIKQRITKEKFVFDFLQYVYGILENSENNQTTLFKTAFFDLVANSTGGNDEDEQDDNSTTIDDGPPKKKVPELLVLTTDGSNDDGTELTQGYSAVITQGDGVKRINSNTFKGRAGTSFSITIRAAAPDRYRIKYFDVLKGQIVDEDSKGFERVNAQELNLDVGIPITVLIKYEKVVPILIPSVTISPSSFKYNLAKPQKLNLGYDSENCDKVTFKLNKTNLTDTDEAGVFTISNSMFNSGVGQYVGYVCPYNEGYGDGVPQKFTINVVNEVAVKTPDIVNISYPELLKGADFKGYDVDFTVSYQSVNTNSVSYTHLRAHET